MRSFETGMCSETCVIRQLLCKHSVHLHTPRLSGIDCYSRATNLQHGTVRNNMRLNRKHEKMLQSRCDKYKMFEAAPCVTLHTFSQQTFFF